MANRYWVGGAGTWNTLSVTNWSASSGGASGAAVPTAADSVFFNSGSGTPGTVTMTGALLCLNITVSVTGWTFATGTTPTLAISGNLALTSGTTWTSTGTITFNSTASQTITTASTAFGCGITFDGVGGTFQLQDALTIGTVRTVTLTNGTLNLNNNNLSCGLFSSSNTNTRTIAFGTGGIYVTGNNGTQWNTDNLTGLSLSGTPSVYLTYSGSAGTRTIFCGLQTNGGYSESNTPSFYVTAGSDTVRFLGTSRTYGTIDLTGFTGQWSSDNWAFTMYGNLVVNSVNTLNTSSTFSGPITFAGVQGTKTIATNGLALNFGTTFNGVGGYYQLQSNLATNSSNTVTLTSGTLDLNSHNLTCAIFGSSNSNTRTLAFGTGQIYLTGNSGTIWGVGTGTNMTISGTPIINATYSGSTGTRQVTQNSIASGNGTLPSVNISAGSDVLSFNGNFGSVDFTGFSGTLTYTSSFNIYGGTLKYSTGMTLSSNNVATQFLGTGTTLITTNGKTLDFPVTFNGVGGTWQLQDALTIGTVRTVTLTNGTLDINNNNLSCGLFSSANSNTRTLAFGTGTIAVTGSGATAWNAATSTNLTTTGTGTISMTSASAKTFVGGGAAYAATLDQGGAGALTITGSNTFRNITASIAPTSAASIVFTAGTTTSLTTGFDVDGTAANAITVSSDTAAAHTLSLASGTVVANYLNLSYSTATGGAAWYLASNSTNGGNLTGWQSIQGTAVTSIGQGITIGRGVVFS